MKKHVLQFALVPMLLLVASTLMAQFKVSGTVKDASGEALVGASVVVKGTTIGALSDVDGKFTLEVLRKSATLAISFVGYANMEKTVDASTNNLDIVLQEGASRLDEVVITGLASNIKRSNVSTTEFI